MCDVECYVNMVVGCGIGCDHSQMWWNDAVMQDAGQLFCVKRGATHNVANISRCDLKCGLEYMERCVKWDAMWDVAWCITVADISGAIWYMVLQSGIVCCERCWCDMKCVMWWEEWWCDVECGVVWNQCQKCGMMQCKMWWTDVMRCEMQWQCVTHSRSHHHSATIFHIKPHFRHSTPYYISQFTYFNTTRSHGVMWNSVVWNLVYVQRFAVPDVGCCALFILMWLWCGIRCDWLM